MILNYRQFCSLIIAFSFLLLLQACDFFKPVDSCDVAKPIDVSELLKNSFFTGVKEMKYRDSISGNVENVKCTYSDFRYNIGGGSSRSCTVYPDRLMRYIAFSGNQSDTLEFEMHHLNSYVIRVRSKLPDSEFFINEDPITLSLSTYISRPAYDTLLAGPGEKDTITRDGKFGITEYKKYSVLGKSYNNVLSFTDYRPGFNRIQLIIAANIGIISFRYYDKRTKTVMKKELVEYI
ncbi:MAG: hypothetical protein V4543_09160 [Bacteroidota bacterium]